MINLFLLVISMQRNQNQAQFLIDHKANDLVSAKTFFKSKFSESCTNLFITNSSSSFRNTMAITTGLSKYHKMVLKKFICMNRKCFNESLVKKELKSALRLMNKLHFLTQLRVFIAKKVFIFIYCNI